MTEDCTPHHAMKIPLHDIAGWRVIPDLDQMRIQLKAANGQERGNRIANGIPAGGWHCVFDMRLDGCADGFVCERSNPDGSISSVLWNAADIRSVYPPMETTHART